MTVDQRIEDNIKLIYSTMYSFYRVNQLTGIDRMVRRNGMDHQDVVQLGRLSYFKALREWDPEKGALNTIFHRIYFNELGMLGRNNKALKRSAEVYSFDEPLPENPELTIRNVVADKKNDYNHVELRTIMEQVLTPRELYVIDELIIKQRYQREVAEEYGVTQRGVSHIKEKALDKLRSELLEN